MVDVPPEVYELVRLIVHLAGCLYAEYGDGLRPPLHAQTQNLNFGVRYGEVKRHAHDHDHAHLPRHQKRLKKVSSLSDGYHVFAHDVDAGVHRHIKVEAAGQVYTQTNEFVYLGGTSTTMPTCPSRSTSAYATHGKTSGSTPSNCTTYRALPSSSRSGC